MADELVGVDLKIGRAKGKLADLKDAIETRFDPAQYRFDLKLDPQTGKHVLTAHGNSQRPPEGGRASLPPRRTGGVAR